MFRLFGRSKKQDSTSDLDKAETLVKKKIDKLESEIELQSKKVLLYHKQNNKRQALHAFAKKKQLIERLARNNNMLDNLAIQKQSVEDSVENISYLKAMKSNSQMMKRNYDSVDKNMDNVLAETEEAISRGRELAALLNKPLGDATDEDELSKDMMSYIESEDINQLNELEAVPVESIRDVEEEARKEARKEAEEEEKQRLKKGYKAQFLKEMRL